MKSLDKKGRTIPSIACIAIGVFILLIAFDIVESEQGSKQAPNFVIGLAGFVFLIAGLMVFVGQKARSIDLLAAVLCLAFGVVAAWASLFGDGEGFSGGLPFVSHETNVKISRFVFGCSALVCFAISAWALKRFLRPAK